MRRGLWLAVVWLAVAPVGWGQLKPVRLQVTKQTQQTKKNDYRSADDGFTRDWITDEMSFTAEVENLSPVVLAGVVIKWAVLVNPADDAAPRIAEGEESVTLAPRQKHRLQTERLAVKGLRHRWLSGHTWWEHQDKLGGYVFEVYVSGQRVALEEYPREFRKTMAGLLPDRWLPSAQGRRW